MCLLNTSMHLVALFFILFFKMKMKDVKYTQMQVSYMNKCIMKTHTSNLINTNLEDHENFDKTLFGLNYKSLKN